MDKQSILGVLPIALLSAAALVLVCGLYVRSKYSRGREQLDSPARKWGGRIVQYAIIAVLLALDFYLILKRDNFRASWSLTFWMMLASFVLGEMIGRWDAYRRVEPDPPPRPLAETPEA